MKSGKLELQRLSGSADDHLIAIRKKQYEDAMREAANDSAFVKRTLKCDEDFVFVDGEIQRQSLLK